MGAEQSEHSSCADKSAVRNSTQPIPPETWHAYGGIKFYDCVQLPSTRSAVTDYNSGEGSSKHWMFRCSLWIVFLSQTRMKKVKINCNKRRAMLAIYWIGLSPSRLITHWWMQLFYRGSLIGFLYAGNVVNNAWKPTWYRLAWLALELL